MVILTNSGDINKIKHHSSALFRVLGVAGNIFQQMIVQIVLFLDPNMLLNLETPCLLTYLSIRVLQFVNAYLSVSVENHVGSLAVLYSILISVSVVNNL